jgi:hypothetical protein
MMNQKDKNEQQNETQDVWKKVGPPTDTEGWKKCVTGVKHVQKFAKTERVT